MRVTLTVEALAPQLTGIGRYTHELTRLIGRQSGVDELRFYRNGEWFEDLSPLLSGTASARRRRWIPRRWREWSQRRFLQASVVHGPNYFLPAGVDGGVITVHDLSVFRFPETHPKERLEQFERQFLDSLKRAAHVITDTEWVRREVMAHFSLSADRVSAVPLGLDHARYHSVASESQACELNEFGLMPGGYALVIATLEPRKKVRELLHAWGRLPAMVRRAYPLVLAGANGWLNDGLHDEIEKGVYEGWLRFLGYVPEKWLPTLYAGAALFLYPSIYEGFGLPPLESMACGTPVLVSEGTCLEEVCADAAAYTNPDDPDRLLRDIATLLESSDLREQLVLRGLARSKFYNWERAASGTADVYRLV